MNGLLEPLLQVEPILARKLRSHGVSWERALRSFSRGAAGGGALELEFAQRVSALFCQGGNSRDLVRWFHLFRCESVPFCSTQLVALGRHDLLREVHTGLQLTAFPWQPLLAEQAMGIAVTQRSIQSAGQMFECFPSFPYQLTSTVSLVQSDHRRRAETQDNAVAKTVLHLSRPLSWENAVKLFLQSSNMVSRESSKKLVDIAVLTAANYDKTSSSNFLKQLPAQDWTPALSRCALRLSLEDRNVRRCIDVLDFSCHSFGSFFTAFMINRVLQLAQESENALSNTLVINKIIAGSSSSCATMKSIEESDREAHDLLLRGNWEAALLVVSLIKSMPVKTSKEKFLLASLSQARHWKDALELFA